MCWCSFLPVTSIAIGASTQELPHDLHRTRGTSSMQCCSSTFLNTPRSLMYGDLSQLTSLLCRWHGHRHLVPTASNKLVPSTHLVHTQRSTRVYSQSVSSECSNEDEKWWQRNIAVVEQFHRTDTQRAHLYEPWKKDPLGEDTDHGHWDLVGECRHGHRAIFVHLQRSRTSQHASTVFDATRQPLVNHSKWNRRARSYDTWKSVPSGWAPKSRRNCVIVSSLFCTATKSGVSPAIDRSRLCHFSSFDYHSVGRCNWWFHRCPSPRDVELLDNHTFAQRTRVYWSVPMQLACVQWP